MYDKIRQIIITLPYDNYNILFDISDKIGSEHWLMVLCWDLLKEKCVKLINYHHDIDNNYPILILDDCIYSGIHMISLINHTTYYYKNTYEKDLSNLFVPVVPYRNKRSGKDIEQFGKKIKIILLI